MMTSAGEFQLADAPVEFYRGAVSRLGTLRRYGRIFIIKGLNPSVGESVVYVGMLRKEFELQSALDHPNIARAISMENIPEWGTVIVMEYVDGVTLDRYLSESSLTSRERIVLAGQLIDALVYAHGAGVSHRDLKPDNVMVTHRGARVKIIDFGLGDSDSHLFMKASRGTASFGAPEQQNPAGSEGAGDFADIYSLGRILQICKLPRRYRTLINGCMAQDAGCRPTIDVVAKRFNAVESGRRRFRSIIVMIAGICCGLGVMVMINGNRRHDEATQHIIDHDVVHDTIVVSIPPSPVEIAPTPQPQLLSPVTSSGIPERQSETSDKTPEANAGQYADVFDNSYAELVASHEQFVRNIEAIDSDGPLILTEEFDVAVSRLGKRSKEIISRAKMTLAERGASEMEITMVENSLWLKDGELYQKETKLWGN